MAIKLVDELKAMGNFPIAHAEGINLVKTDGTEDNLQNLYDNGELGGGDDSVTLTQQEYEALSEEEKLDGLYYTYDTKRIYKNGVQYGASEPIPLTMEEYKALKEAGAIDEQQEYLVEADADGTLLGAEDLKKSSLVYGGNIVGALGDKNFSTAPIGTVLSFAGQTAPNGYLLCNGASYPTADYPDLYAVIGNTYGGDSTNFNVPNLVDKFVQGSTTSGTEKEAGLPNITGGFYSYSYFNGTPSGAITTSVENRNQTQPGGDNMRTYIHYLLDASRSSSVYGNSDTVQPPSLTMVYIIKAFHTNEGVDSDAISDEYSTYEIKTNKVWVDGKPIYRKVINFGTLPNNNIKKVSHGILNIDTFVSINGITFTSEKTATALPYAHSDSTNEVSLFIESTDVAIRTFGDKTNYIKTYVTLEYTKTTD